MEFGVIKINNEWICKPDGMHELDLTEYRLQSRLKNVTVEILEDKEGNCSIGWYRQPDTVDITDI